MSRGLIYICLSAMISSAFILECTGSAIPMWEYLSRDEKMSHLYSMFAKQVQQYCKSRSDLSKPQCKRDLLMYGLNKLNTMSESHIDTMDPYQRGANDIIWDSMMNGHPMMTEDAQTTSTQRPATFEPAASHQGGQTNQGLFFKEQGDSSYANDMELSYDNNYVPQSSNVNLQYLDNNEPHYLTGPMVFRVHPDGTPVSGDREKPLPKDDDRDDMTMGRDRLPTMDEIRMQYRQVPFTRPKFAFRIIPSYSNL